CGSLKNEGAAFLLLLAGTAAAASLRRRRLWPSIAVFGSMPFVAILALRLLARPVAADFQWASLASGGGSEGARRLPLVATFFGDIFLVRTFPALLAVAGVFLLTRRGIADILLVPIGLLIALFAVAPLFSSWSDPVLFARWTFPRISCGLVPVLLL